MKNEMKHTQGPWEVQLTGGRKLITANGSLDDVAHTVGLEDESEDEANAVLIAAAPEMLEALSEAWGYVFYYVNDPNTQDKDAINVLQKMDRAIVKAKGGVK